MNKTNVITKESFMRAMLEEEKRKRKRLAKAKKEEIAKAKQEKTTKTTITHMKTKNMKKYSKSTSKNN